MTQAPICRVWWEIPHPGTLSKIKCETFEEAMTKWFEGFNIPVLVVDGVREDFSKSNDRVRKYYSITGQGADSQNCSVIPPTCESCHHRDFDETPDGENMWSWCKHPNIPNEGPYFGRVALGSEHGTNPPPPECPLRKKQNT